MPESKRYPENAVDESIILARHNLVATHVLGGNADCLLVVTRREGCALEPIYADLSTGFSPIYRFDEDDDMEPLISWASTIRWFTVQYDDIILAEANEDIYNTLFISPSHGGIYAPYDGGADVFHVDAVRLNEIKARYQEWASKHPEGL